MITGRFKTIAFDTNGELVKPPKTPEELKAEKAAIAKNKRDEAREQRNLITQQAKIAAATAVTMANRRFVMAGSTGVDKEWNISIVGNNVVVKWGRVGNSLQEKVHGFSGVTDAKNFAAAIISNKLGKGYKEV